MSLEKVIESIADFVKEKNKDGKLSGYWLRFSIGVKFANNGDVYIYNPELVVTEKPKNPRLPLTKKKLQ